MRPMLSDGLRPSVWVCHARNRTATGCVASDALGCRRMASSKRIAILTGGGDVPGLNAVIKSVVYRATEAGYEVLGIRRGWEGLTHVQPELTDGGGTGYLRPLDRINT